MSFGEVLSCCAPTLIQVMNHECNGATNILGGGVPCAIRGSLGLCLVHGRSIGYRGSFSILPESRAIKVKTDEDRAQPN